MSDMPPTGWYKKVEVVPILCAVVAAFAFGGYFTTNSIVARQGEQINRIESRVNQNVEWMRAIQSEQKKQNEETAALLTAINTQIAEIKGATIAGKRR